MYLLPKNHIWSWFKRSFTKSVRLIKSTEQSSRRVLHFPMCSGEKEERGKRKGDKPRENSGCHDIHLCKNSWVWDFLGCYFGSGGQLALQSRSFHHYNCQSQAR